MKLLLLLILITLCQALDVYVVRHGARSPTKDNITDIFGVAAGQLTMPGRSQAYYYGKLLRQKYKDINDEEFEVYSSPKSRCQETAKYFLLGWYGHDHRSSKGVFFQADPKYRPPGSEHVKLQKVLAFVDPEEYSWKIGIVDKNLTSGHECWQSMLKQKPLTVDELNILRKIESRQICQKFEKLNYYTCKTNHTADSLLKQATKLEDIARCFNYINKTIDGVAQEDYQLLLQARMMSERKKTSVEPRLAAATTLFYQKLEQVIKQNTTKLIILFSHDNHQIALVRTILGAQEFQKVFQKEIRVPFLSALRLKIREGQFKAYLNDEPLSMKQCQQNTDKCTTTNMFDMLQPYMIPYEDACTKP